MGKIYSIKTGKKITNGTRLELESYCLRIIYTCPNGHKYFEEYTSENIMKHGMDACLKESINNHDKIYCPECDEMVEVGKRPKPEPK